MHLRGGISATVQGWNQLYMGLQNHFYIVEDYWTSYLFTWVIMIKVICIWLANNSNSLCQCITLSAILRLYKVNHQNAIDSLLLVLLSIQSLLALFAIY